MKKIMNVVGTTALVLATTLTLTWLGPYLETSVYPVVIQVDAVTIEHNSQEASIAVLGRKIRDCRYIETRVLVLRNGFWQKADVTFSTATGVATRPTGQQHFGIWKMTPSGEMVKLTVIHQCHPFWELATDFGTWNIK